MSNLVGRPAAGFHTMQEVSPDLQFDTLGDLQLVNKLLQNPRYDIPERLRKKVLKCAEKILDSDMDPKYQLAAGKLVLEADKRNMDLIKLVMPKKQISIDVKQKTTEELIEVVRSAQKFLPPETTVIS